MWIFPKIETRILALSQRRCRIKHCGGESPQTEKPKLGSCNSAKHGYNEMDGSTQLCKNGEFVRTGASCNLSGPFFYWPNYPWPNSLRLPGPHHGGPAIVARTIVYTARVKLYSGAVLSIPVKSWRTLRFVRPNFHQLKLSRCARCTHCYLYPLHKWKSPWKNEKIIEVDTGQILTQIP